MPADLPDLKAAALEALQIELDGLIKKVPEVQAHLDWIARDIAYLWNERTQGRDTTDEEAILAKSARAVLATYTLKATAAAHRAVQRVIEVVLTVGAIVLKKALVA